MDNNKPTKETIITTVALALGLINQVLAVFGKSPIPVSSEQVVLLLSTAWTIGAALWAYWHNNSWTKAAIKADELLKQLKAGNTDEL